jgi:mannobiose 2-epimerase
VWEDASLKAQHKALIEIFLAHIIDQAAGHFKLFFDDQWHSFSDAVSFGHDIEGSWLLMEAAEVQGDEGLAARVREAALKMATAVYREGLDADGSLLYEGGPHGITIDAKHWWPQAEAVVGFYNAYQASGQATFAEAAYRCWTYILAKMVDRQYGDWYKLLDRAGAPDLTVYKVSPWNCPYHHSRVCFEMLDRLAE